MPEIVRENEINYHIFKKRNFEEKKKKIYENYQFAYVNFLLVISIIDHPLILIQRLERSFVFPLEFDGVELRLKFHDVSMLINTTRLTSQCQSLYNCGDN